MTNIELFMKAEGFLSPLDEEMFFEWMIHLECSGDYIDDDTLKITLSGIPNQDRLWMLISFFFRYDIDLRQLTRFETAENSQWLRNPNAYWHNKMFRNE